MIEEINGGNNSTDSKNTNPNRRAIHIHGRMKHNVAGYTKYYSYGSTKISKGSGFIRKINHNRRKNIY
jgi:hypothetical protein